MPHLQPVLPGLDEPAPDPRRPAGLAYVPDLITPEEERTLVAALRELPFAAFEFHGHLGKRRVVFFGATYDFSRQKLGPAPEMPAALVPLQERVVGFAGVEASDIRHALVTEYGPGAGIGWHRDKGVFDKVIGVSLLAACRFRLRRKAGARWQRYEFEAAPRSAYLLDGEARDVWEHSIPPVEALRYSVTLRTMRDRDAKLSANR
jgi:alkylated DNA repair dioxygenase AlkB